MRDREDLPSISRDVPAEQRSLDEAKATFYGERWRHFFGQKFCLHNCGLAVYTYSALGNTGMSWKQVLAPGLPVKRRGRSPLTICTG